MTVAGYNMGGDLDLCAREENQTKFLANVKKLALQRNVSARTIMLWCYFRAENPTMLSRLQSWIEEEDKKKSHIMDLPEYIIPDPNQKKEENITEEK